MKLENKNTQESILEILENQKIRISKYYEGNQEDLTFEIEHKQKNNIKFRAILKDAGTIYYAQFKISDTISCSYTSIDIGNVVYAENKTLKDFIEDYHSIPQIMERIQILMKQMLQQNSSDYVNLLDSGNLKTYAIRACGLLYLFSYDQKIMIYDLNTKILLIKKYIRNSATTNKHISAFIRQYVSTEYKMKDLEIFGGVLYADFT